MLARAQLITERFPSECFNSNNRYVEEPDRAIKVFY